MKNSIDIPFDMKIQSKIENDPYNIATAVT